MIEHLKELQSHITRSLGPKIRQTKLEFGELTVEVDPTYWIEVALFLRDDEQLGFDQLIDLCGVDYLTFGQSEWSASNSGFSRGVEAKSAGRFSFDDDTDTDVAGFEGQRFAVVMHLLSVQKNHRIRVKAFCEDNDFPMLDSVIDVWNSVNWFEREAFDLFGIMFSGHPDLRRILTDYGFVGHPFRKDFPLVGHVEMRYDADKQRVVYEPVSIEPRVLIPRVIREDSRFESPLEGDH